MAIQTTSNLTNSIRTQYVSEYLTAAYGQRLYDQLAIPVPNVSMDEAMRGSSVQYDFLSSMLPGTTAISQTADITPQILRDATASVTPTSRGEALQWSENTDIQAYTNYGSERFKKLGENMMESVELLATAAACQGTWVERATTRADTDAGTAGHRASETIFRKYQAMLLEMKVPGFINDMGEANTWAAIMHPHVFHDIVNTSGGNVAAIGQYQDKGIHLNFELAMLGPFRLVVSPYAKVFGGAGIANGTAVSTTLNGAEYALDTTIVTAADVSANVAAGLYWTIGTTETANTFYPTNERIRPVSASTTTITFIGQGENGGLRFGHDAGAAVKNNDSVYTIVFGGPGSLVKLFAPSVGEYGAVVGPKDSGIADQFSTIAWKYYGNYGRLRENSVLRYECSVSVEA